LFTGEKLLKKLYKALSLKKGTGEIRGWKMGKVGTSGEMGWDLAHRLI
jgi:hypothetical protein